MRFDVPRLLLRLEGAVVFVVGVGAYAFLNVSWWLFAALILVPDLFMVGYLMGPRVGAGLYNVGHTYVVPLLLGGYAVFYGLSLWVAIALIWIVHIGMDRMFGFGLKYPSGFHDTHLGPWSRITDDSSKREG